MVVFLNFLKYRRIVLFPEIVVSAFVGFVLNMCHDLNCLMTGSRFWYFFISCSVTFSFVDKKKFPDLILLVGLYRVGHGDQKLGSLCIWVICWWS